MSAVWVLTLRQTHFCECLYIHFENFFVHDPSVGSGVFRKEDYEKHQATLPLSCVGSFFDPHFVSSFCELLTGLSELNNGDEPEFEFRCRQPNADHGSGRNSADANHSSCGNDADDIEHVDDDHDHNAGNSGQYECDFGSPANLAFRCNEFCSSENGVFNEHITMDEAEILL